MNVVQVLLLDKTLDEDFFEAINFYFNRVILEIKTGHIQAFFVESTMGDSEISG